MNESKVSLLEEKLTSKIEEILKENSMVYLRFENSMEALDLIERFTTTDKQEDISKYEFSYATHELIDIKRDKIATFKIEKSNSYAIEILVNNLRCRTHESFHTFNKISDVSFFMDYYHEKIGFFAKEILEMTKKYKRINFCVKITEFWNLERIYWKITIKYCDFLITCSKFEN